MSPTARRTPPPEEAPWLLEIIGVVLLVINMFLSAVTTGRTAPSASGLLGVALAPAVIGLVVIGVASVFSGMRNRRSRAKIFVATMCLVLLGNCGNLGSMARNRELSAPPNSPAPTT
jgi:hypothetical protein